MDFIKENWKPITGVGVIILIVAVLTTVIVVTTQSEIPSPPTSSPIRGPISPTRSPTNAPTRSPHPTPPPTYAPTQAPFATSAPIAQAPTAAPIPDAAFCGPLTIWDAQLGQCRAYISGTTELALYVDGKTNEGELLVGNNGNIIYTGEGQGAPLDTYERGTPDWFTYWINGGGNACSKFISNNNCGITNCEPNGVVPCECSDCAGWRGGNKTACEGQQAERASMACTVDCASGQSGPCRKYVDGTSLSICEPYYNGTDCATNYVDCDCNTSSACPNVETGVDPRVTCELGSIFDTWFNADRCACSGNYCPLGGLCTNPYSMEGSCCPDCITRDCAGKTICDDLASCEIKKVRQPGTVYSCSGLPPAVNGEVSITESEFNIKCTTSPSNFINGDSEYECVYDCANSNTKQVDCSLKCLPQLWEWNSLNVDGQLKGFVNTNELIDYKPITNKLSTCDSFGGDCLVGSFPVEQSDIINCKDCTNCFWQFNNISNEFEFICQNCGKCQRIEDNSLIEVTNGQNCRGCIFHETNYDSNVSKPTCGYCDTSDPTTNHYTISGTETTNPGQTSFYNQGQDYDPNEYSNGATVLCTDKPYGNTQSCENPLDGNQGWADGGGYAWNASDSCCWDCSGSNISGSLKECNVPLPPNYTHE